jgi:AcrR family transcriptional regulator
VAEAAGFTIGAVYSRFGSKADLFLAILDQHIDRLVAEVARVPEDLLSTMAVSFLRGVAADAPAAEPRS